VVEGVAFEAAGVTALSPRSPLKGSQNRARSRLGQAATSGSIYSLREGMLPEAETGGLGDPGDLQRSRSVKPGE
jgi:hypothetical protein